MTKLTIKNPLDWRSRALLAESEEARLREENERLKQILARSDSDEEARLRAALQEIRAMADQQAEDEGLWFIRVTASEAYLQQELRSLHDRIERLTA